MAEKIRVLISEDEIGRRLDEMAKQINADYAGREIRLLCILKGSVFVTCELAKRLTVPVTMDFLTCSSYEDGTVSNGDVKCPMGLSQPLKEKHVLVVEDIIDSGKTLSYLLEKLGEEHPASLKLCTLLDKPFRREKEVHVDYVGFQLKENAFVVGFGLDIAQKYRNLPYVGVVDKCPENVQA